MSGGLTDESTCFLQSRFDFVGGRLGDGRLIDGHLAVLHHVVLAQKPLRDEALLADVALVRTLARVQTRVNFEHGRLAELEPADGADARVVHHFNQAGRSARTKVVGAEPSFLLNRWGRA